MGVTGFDLRL